jgi:protein TonB
VKDPVNTLLVERQALERGFGSSLLLSGFGHGFLLAAVLIASLMPPPVPRMDVFTAFAVPLPRGGGGEPNAAPPATAPRAPEPPKAEPAPVPPPPKIAKPPKDEPSRALPDPSAKKAPKPAERAAPRTIEPPDAGVARSTTGAAAAAQGLDLSFPPGVGTPTGSQSGGDFYLASVQQRIWMIWMQQVRAEQAQTVSVSFTILADGSVADVQIVQSSGGSLLDMAARRAVMAAAPFRPLPRTYGTDRITIQANFKPTP